MTELGATALCSFFFSSRRRHTSWNCDWSSDVCSSDLDAFTSGGMVAELLTGFTHGPASVLIVTGDLSVVDHAEKVDGFRSFIEKANSPLKVRSEERRVGKECRCWWEPGQ